MAKKSAPKKSAIPNSQQAQPPIPSVEVLTVWRQPGPDTVRNFYELEAMLGKSLGHDHISAPFPYARNMTDAHEDWKRYLQQWSCGLSVSELPRHLLLEDQLLNIHPRTTGTFADWSEATNQVEFQVGNRQRHIPGLALPDGWTYANYVSNHFGDAVPSPLDIPNKNLFDICDGSMICTVLPYPDYCKVEFWRQLLSTWEGPVNTRSQSVNDLLDHHHDKGGSADVFRDFVRDTIDRLHALPDMERNQPATPFAPRKLRNTYRCQPLAEKLDHWIKENTPTNEGANPKLTWQGSAGELSLLIHELADKGWIPNLSAEKQAGLVVQIFTKKDGSPVCRPGSMKTNLVLRGVKDPGDMLSLKVPKKKKPK